MRSSGVVVAGRRLQIFATIAIVALFTFVAPVATAAEPFYEQSRSSAVATLWKAIERQPYKEAKIIENWNNRGNYTRTWTQRIVSFSYKSFHFGTDVDEANALTKQMLEYYLAHPADAFEIHSFPPNAVLLGYIQRDFGHDGVVKARLLSPANESLLKQLAAQWLAAVYKPETHHYDLTQFHRITNSENHDFLHLATAYAFLNLFGEQRASERVELDQYIKNYVGDKALTGTFIEVASKGYNTGSINALLLIHDLTADPQVKQTIANFLDLYFALWGETQIDGVSGQAAARLYPDWARTNGLNGPAWLTHVFFGYGQPPAVAVYAHLLPALVTSYKPREIVGKIIIDPKTTPYHALRKGLGLTHDGLSEPPLYQIQRNAFAWAQYTYVGDGFVMGSFLQHPSRSLDELTRISSQNRWCGAIFQGAPEARVYPMMRLPDDGKVSHNSFFSLQQDGALVFRRLPTTRTPATAAAGKVKDDDESEAASKEDQGQPAVWIGNPGLTVFETTADHVLIESATCYIAVSIDDGGLKIEQDAKRGGQYATLNNRDDVGAVEVVPKRQYAAKEDFASAYRAKPRFDQTESADRYLPMIGTPIAINRDIYATENGTRFNEILKEKFVYQSPYVSALIGGTAVTLSAGSEVQELDFKP